MSADPEKPVLIYDGDCGFCRRWIHRWRAQTLGRVRFATSRESASRYPRIPARDFEGAVILVDADQRVYRGAEAVFRALSRAPGGGRGLWLYRRLPGFAAAAEAFYAVVAANRIAASRVSEWLWGRSVEPSTYLLGRWVFLRALGLIYLIAFASYWLQLKGLVGREGILPAAPVVSAVAERFGAEAYRLFPTLALVFGGDDASLTILCALGAVFAQLLIAGFAQLWSLLALWALYLSLVTVGREFYGFQWENLLLEAGLLALFVAPRTLSRRLEREAAAEPSRAGLWLLKFLLFRLMFSSGVVKLASGDPAWRDLSALTVHYETQPLPTWTAWAMHQLPRWFHQGSVLFMFVVELAVPFLIFLPRRPRRAGCFCLALLQLLILATGNYAYFNWLTLALCALLLDDGDWRRMLPPRITARLARRGERRAPARPTPAGQARRALAAGAALLLFLAGAGRLVQLAEGRASLPSPVRELLDWTEPFRVANGYGLFAVMTQPRNEIIVEGSDDGKSWLPYEFKYKPGDVRRRPGFVAPYQPRLDWQMWFAALGPYESSPWFRNFEAALLRGSPAVLGLLEKDPFGGRPPRYLRAELYRYSFTAPGDPEARGAWWKRERIGPFGPELSAKAAKVE